MLKPGDLVGPYEIRGFLGQGGMGQVYRAFDTRLERTVALKVIVVPESGPAISKADSERIAGEFSARLLREARAVASLSHPNVVAIYDVGEHAGRLYLAMEYVVGSTLRALVGDTEIPLARKVRWLVDIARALEAAHKAGIVHRDVKPENVMVREDGGVKVLDFGIARRTMTADDQGSIDTITGGGSIAGTPVYMAPEQIRGNDVDARCDQFAWGVTAYELVAGERPWPESGDVLSLVARVLTDPPRSLRERAEGVPAVVEETIVRALAKEPGARFPSMAAVADALEPFATQTTGGERIRITPREEAAAYAATTRVPTTTSVHPSGAPHGAAKADVDADADRRARRRSITRLGLPLALIGALAAAVYVVRTTPNTGRGTTTTPSAQRPLSTVPEAESAYREAMSLWHDGSSAKARAALERAVKLDETFAAAHLELAVQTSTSDPAAAQQSFQAAFQHRHMLVARDSAFLEASEPFVRPSPDLGEWETRMTSVVFQFPRDPELQFYLGRARERQGDDDGARSAYEASVRLDDGFVPGLAALAHVEKNLGHVQEGLATTERCIKRSPVASTCLETRYELFSAIAECKRAREEATQWGALEPQSPRPFGALARALHADGAPRPSVEEVLGRRWSLVPEADRKRAETWDRMHLAMIDGDLPRADELATDYDGLLTHGADASDHAEPALVRINVAMELDRMKDAAKAARSYLDRLPAWAPYPFAPDPSISFYEPLFRAGEMSRAELDAKRAAWLQRDKQRDGRGGNAAWLRWMLVYGSFAETREEALEAIANLPAGEELPVPVRRPLGLDFALGKVHALLGPSHAKDALTHLDRVTGSCATFDGSMIIVRARWYSGQVYEATGNPTGAKAAYQKIVDAWPKRPSRTVKQATARLAAL